MNPQNFNRYAYCLNNPLKYNDPSGHLVMFYEGDPNLLMLVWAWEKFMGLCPNEAAVMITSDQTYIIATHINQESSASYGDSRLDTALILIGANSINQGIDRITLTQIHEILGHLMEGNAGASQLEEFISWRITSGFAEAMGIDDIGNPGGNTDDFWEWATNIEAGQKLYMKLPLLELTQEKIDQILEDWIFTIDHQIAMMGNAFGDLYTYGSIPSAEYDWWYWWFYYGYYF